MVSCSGSRLASFQFCEDGSFHVFSNFMRLNLQACAVGLITMSALPKLRTLTQFVQVYLYLVHCHFNLVIGVKAKFFYTLFLIMYFAIAILIVDCGSWSIACKIQDSCTQSTLVRYSSISWDVRGTLIRYYRITVQFLRVCQRDNLFLVSSFREKAQEFVVKHESLRASFCFSKYST